MPANFLCVGLIHLILPRAKIIHVNRNPIDTCLSNYFQFFAHPMMNFSFDWADLLHFYRGYRRLIDCLGRRYGEAIHHVQYEQFVAKPEPQRARLAAFLGLSGEPAQGRQGNNTIRTASIWQARQDIYQSSVARWKNYEPLMSEALKNELEGLR